MSSRYELTMLQSVSPDYGDRFVVEFQNVYSKYLGDIFPKTIIERKDGTIYEVEFEVHDNASPSSNENTLSDISKGLKEKLKSTKDLLRKKRVKQSYKEILLIMEAFDERWLNEFNLILIDDKVVLKCWGIKYKKISVENNNLKKHNSQKNVNIIFK